MRMTTKFHYCSFNLSRDIFLYGWAHHGLKLLWRKRRFSNSFKCKFGESMCAKLISLTSKYSSSTKIRLNHIYICVICQSIKSVISTWPRHHKTATLDYTFTLRTDQCLLYSLCSSNVRTEGCKTNKGFWQNAKMRS